ncbi:hypothetical protein MNBD_GAMMA22-2933 [hydrothermal vent metagenome]|uniref:Uncharacterized protein n=1 Tax=hydrothermal vent metagenome TaxID=652676 RepID=A0A3B1B417_9ZZZZ
MNTITENNDDPKNLKIDRTILADEQPILFIIFKAFRNLDKVCYRLGLLNKNSSLASDINWAVLDEKNNLPQVLNQLDSTRDQVEQQIYNLKKMMTSRCLNIIFWEFTVILIIIIALLASSYFAGYWVSGQFSASWLPELLSRPILITVSALLFVGGFVVLHYSLRSFFANRIAKNYQAEDTAFTLTRAFLKNSKFTHSIFRPEPVGLHWLNRKRIQKAHELYLIYNNENQ